KLATAVQGFPVSFAIGGKQYNGVATGKGGGRPRGGPKVGTPGINPPQYRYRVYLFALPGQKEKLGERASKHGYPFGNTILTPRFRFSFWVASMLTSEIGIFEAVSESKTHKVVPTSA